MPPCNFRKDSTISKHGLKPLTRQMADPAVIADGETYRKTAKARSELEEVVNKYREYKQAKHNYDEARSRCWRTRIPSCARWPPTK